MATEYDFSSDTQADVFRRDVITMGKAGWELVDQGVAAAGAGGGAGQYAAPTTTFIYWAFWRRMVEADADD